MTKKITKKNIIMALGVIVIILFFISFYWKSTEKLEYSSVLPHLNENKDQNSHQHVADLPVQGLSIQEKGYRLKIVKAPTSVNDSGLLYFDITDLNGNIIKNFEVVHDKKMHIIVVRTDGSEYKHLHPSQSKDGTWTLPWVWNKAGSYHIFTDFVPGDLGEGITLRDTLKVEGEFKQDPILSEENSIAKVDEFTVFLSGKINKGEKSQFVFTIEKNGQSVSLQPYLGAMGHLIVLRKNDFAFLHVHPNFEEKDFVVENLSQLVFEAIPPSDGGYYLYMDFKVDEQVYTAQFFVNVPFEK